MTLFDAVLSGIGDKLGASDFALEIPKEKSFGDFAANVAMRIAKKDGKNPKDVAKELIPKIKEIDFVEDADMAGPGFVNIKIKNEFIIKTANEERVEKTEKPETVDMDYGSYNVAKRMHIGHLRGSIIGDTMRRVAKFLGHRPVSYNYIGDWGRPIATIIATIKREFPNDWAKPDFKIDAEKLNDYYPLGAELAEKDAGFLKEVLEIKKEFQDGHAEYFALYEKFLEISLREMDAAVKRLGMLPFDNNLGERNASKYLDAVEKILRDKNMLAESDGAIVVPLKNNGDNAPMPPMMFRDSRGADTYDSTDLATVYYRKITDNPDRLLYMSDFRQNLHFKQLFRASELAGLFSSDKMESLGYGSINGADGKPFKTREGKAAALSDVMDMVDAAARARVKESGKTLPEETIKMIALAALKFNDLMHDVKSNYTFDPDAVTSFEGRTGPYVLYAAVRLNSALKKSEISNAAHKISDIANDYERGLLMKTLELPNRVRTAWAKRAPDILANYAYDLAQTANGFYHNCPIKDDKNRMAIAHKASKALETCLDLMGLKVPDEM